MSKPDWRMVRERYWQECRVEFEAGQTLKQIAASASVCIRTVTANLRAVGTKIRPRGSSGARMQPNAARCAAILARLAADRTLQDVATEFGISRQRVSQIMRRAGMKRDGMGTRCHSETIAARMAKQAAARERRASAVQVRREKRQRKALRLVGAAKKLRDKGLSWAECAAGLSMIMATLHSTCLRYAPEMRVKPLAKRRKRAVDVAAPRRPKRSAELHAAD